MEYSSYSRLDKLGKVADWTTPSEPLTSNGNQSLRKRRDEKQEENFISVDRQLATLRKSALRSTKQLLKKPIKTKYAKTVGYATKVTKPRDSSIKVQTTWKITMELDFNRMGNLYLSVEDAVDLKVEGNARVFEKNFDKANVKSPIPIIQEQITFPTTTSDDSVLCDLAKTVPGPKIVATDVILACLMNTLKSVYSWDLIITKKNDTLVIDKRDGGVLGILSLIIDYVSVNENAAEPPETNTEGINSAEALKAEATMLQKSFREMTGGDGLVRYRKLDLGGVNVVYRANVHARSNDSESLLPEELINTYILNEFDYKAPGAGGSFEWRKKLVSQRGAVIATEMKNNSNKLCRFMTEAYLAGVGVSKCGFVSRKNPRDRKAHQLLMTTTNLPEEFMSNMAYDVNSGFGILKAVGDVLLGYDDGKYVVVRDPVKPMLVFYQL